MFKKDHMHLLKLYAVSPVHAGSGSSTGAVDLPIQRERHTNWPHIQASGVKGALRAHFREMVDGTHPDNNINTFEKLIFGTEDYQVEGEPGKREACPGAISVSDAKLLAFPVRSNIAPFVWVTCPAVLARLDRDLVMMGRTGIENLSACKAEKDTSICLAGGISGEVLLEDAVVKVGAGTQPITFLAENFGKIDRLLLISDEMYAYCVNTCTEVQTQIKIDEKTGTAQGGALRYEELLPADSLLYTVVAFDKAGLDNDLQVQMVQDKVKEIITGFMQIGGDATLGRGICRIDWLGGEQ